MRLFLAGLVIVVLTSVSANADQTVGYITGATLVRQCEGADLSACGAYIAGALDASNAIGSNFTRCIPRDVSLDQIRMIVLRDVKSRPQGLGYQAATVILGALGSIFPCPPR